MQAAEQLQASRAGGLDALRVLAMLLVVVFHLLVVWNQLHWACYRGLDLGQAGVSIFFAISGALAASTTRSPSEWLLARVRHIFPPYWIVLALSFCLTAAFGYKSFGVSQILLQFAGLGILLPSGSAVNGATWFISLILLCYAVIYLARLTTVPMLTLSVLMLVCGGCVYGGVYPLLADHVLTFLAAFSIYRVASLACSKTLIGVGALCLLGCAIDARLAYTSMSLLLLALSTTVASVPSPITRLSSLSYEFYLLHGIFIVGAHRFLRNWPAPAILASIAASLAGAWLLQQTVRALLKRHERPRASRGSEASRPLRLNPLGARAPSPVPRSDARTLCEQEGHS